MAFSFLRNFKSTAKPRTSWFENETLALLIDIGSASVGGALVKIGEGKAPHLLTTVREDIPFQEELSSTRFVLAMNHALDRVLKTMQSRAVGSPSQIFCTLSSPWFILKNRHLNVSQRDAFTVTERALEEFLNQDIENLKEELKEKLPPKDMRVIEKKVIQMKLNGYDIKNPYGCKASQMEIAMTVGVSSARVIQSIEKKLGNFFHTAALHFGVFPLAAFSAVRDIFPHEKNFLFLDITGEATDVSLANDALLAGTVSFPYGKNFFIREISAGLRTPHEEAASLLNMFLAGTLHDAKQNDVKNMVERAEKAWLARFEKALTTLSKEGVIPRKVFFAADVDIAEFFSKIIGKAKSDLRTGEAFEVDRIEQSLMTKFVSFESGVTRDPFLAVEALLAAKVAPQIYTIPK